MSEAVALFIGINRANLPVVISLSKFYRQIICTSESSSSLITKELPLNTRLICLSSHCFASCLQIALIIKPISIFSWGSNYFHFIAEMLTHSLSLNDPLQYKYSSPSDWSRNRRFLVFQEYLLDVNATSLAIPKFYSLSIRDALNTANSPMSSSNAVVLKVNSLSTHGFCLYVDSFVSDLSPYIPILAEHIDPRDSSIFVQQFIDGQHYSVDSFVIDGKPTFVLVGQKIMSSDDLFHTQSVSYNNISDDEEIIFAEAITYCISCFSINNGFIHLELCAHESKFYVIDITLRPPGSLSASIIYPYVSRFSLTDLFRMRLTNNRISSSNASTFHLDKRIASLYHVNLSKYGNFLSSIDEEKLNNDPIVLDYLVDSTLLRPLSGHENNKPRSLILAIKCSDDCIQSTNFDIDKFIHQYFTFL